MATIHNPLPDNSRYTRAISLPFDKDEDGIINLKMATTEIFEESISTGADISFTAISYEWGPAAPVHKIRLDGRDMLIRDNIFRFLEHCYNTGLQHELGSSLWIDAICIDQDTLAERNAQVQIMGSIFKQAVQVVVWFGEASESSFLEPYAVAQRGVTLKTTDFEPIDAFTHIIPELYRLVDDRKNARIWSRLHSSLASAEVSFYNALGRLLNNSYWGRLWIVQELLLARQCSFVSGSMLLGLLVLWKVCCFGSPAGYTLRNERANPSAEMRTIMEAWIGRNIRDRTRTGKGLLALVADFAHHKCQDPRDHLFGLLGIADQEVLSVDYSTSCEELFWMALRTGFTLEGTAKGALTSRGILQLLKSLNLTSEQVAMSNATSQHCFVKFHLWHLRRDEQGSGGSWVPMAHAGVPPEADCGGDFTSVTWGPLLVCERCPATDVLLAFILEGSGGGLIGLAFDSSRPEHQAYVVHQKATYHQPTEDSPARERSVSICFEALPAEVEAESLCWSDGRQPFLYADLSVIMLLYKLV